MMTYRIPNTTRLFMIAIAGLVLLAPSVAARHTITITSDAPREGTATLTVDVQNFNLVPFAGKAAMKGEGHIHYLANGKDACSAKRADCKAATDYATPAKTFTYTNLDKGDQLQAELVLSDHKPSGTDANGNLDGSRVLSKELTVKGAGIPGFEFIFVLAAVSGIVFLGRRRNSSR